jgi:hypothetical protein
MRAASPGSSFWTARPVAVNGHPTSSYIMIRSIVCFLPQSAAFHGRTVESTLDGQSQYGLGDATNEVHEHCAQSVVYRCEVVCAARRPEPPKLRGCSG